MFEFDFINEEEFNTARSEEMKLASPERGGILAPHFVMMVKEYLAEKYGEDLIQNGGLRVYTTLNWETQRKAETSSSSAPLRLCGSSFCCSSPPLTPLPFGKPRTKSISGSWRYWNCGKTILPLPLFPGLPWRIESVPSGSVPLNPRGTEGVGESPYRPLVQAQR